MREKKSVKSKNESVCIWFKGRGRIGGAEGARHSESLAVTPAGWKAKAAGAVRHNM